MFPSIRFSRVSGLGFRLSVFSAALLAVAGFVPQASAQTAVAPQLLPYTTKLIAGGGATAATVGATCQRAVYPATNPVTYTSSGYTSTDTYGDGCLSTEVVLKTPRFVVADSTGAVFFSDYGDGLIRRVDPVTGIITVVAGGATANTVGTSGTPVACGAYFSTDALGDGCLANAVKLGDPTGLAFDASGNLYFADYYDSVVRKIAATGGVITTTGVVTNVAGQPSGTYGYNVTNTSTTPPVIAATQGILNDPYGLAFDSAGNLYIADEDNQAIEVVNLTANSETILGNTITPGSIWKIVGYGNASQSSSPKVTASANSGDCPDYGAAAYGSTYRGGCSYSSYTNGVQATKSNLDGVYSVAVDPSGNVYFPDEYYNVLSDENATTTNIGTYAGIYPLSGDGVKEANTIRGLSTAVGIGSSFGVASDSSGNIYMTDAFNGFIWRIDATTQTMYVVAGGASATCGTVDTYGDGCTGLQTTFGKTGTYYATTSSPGVYGVSADAYGDIYAADTTSNLIREVASGTQFGNIGASQTDNVDIHFGPGDGPAATSPYTITAGGSIFTVGTATCTVNSDNNGANSTQDCILPITATPSVSGPFMGTLKVVSKLSGTASFSLSGNFVQSPITRTAVAVSSTTGCSGTTYSTTTPETLTASITANGPSAPTGMIIFSSNGTPLAPTSGVAVINIGTTANPIYGATLSYTFSTPNSYVITAQYVPTIGSYFTGSTSGPANITITTPTFTAAATSYMGSTVSPGQTALYSFNINAAVYSGTVTFACTGLPANSSCSFSPTSIMGAGCSTTSTIALSILTQAKTVVQAGIGGNGNGPWRIAVVFAGLLFATLIGTFRRRIPLRTGQLLLVFALLLAATGLTACGKAAGTQLTAPTPAGSYTITVTATGSDSTVSSFTVPLQIL